MNEKIEVLVKFLELYKLTIRGMSGENIIITDQETGEEYVVKGLGYPF